jgi:hypothetical protein
MQLGAPQSAAASFAQAVRSLHPAENICDTLAHPFTDRIAGMVRGAPVKRRALSACSSAVAHRPWPTLRCGAVGRFDLKVDQDGVAVLHQRVGRAAQLRFLTRILAGIEERQVSIYWWAVGDSNSGPAD